MLSLDVSWCILFGAIFAAAWLAVRWHYGRTKGDLPHELSQQLAELKDLVHQARAESDRLEAAIERAAALPAHLQSRLTRIERLNDADQLDDPSALAEVAGCCAENTWIDPFENEPQRMAVARLADQGNTAAEIARRLGRPIGEVELLLSLR